MSIDIVGYLQLKNELQQGNLHRVLTNMQTILGPDKFVIYDDGSDDGSQEVYKQYTSHVIHGTGGEFTNELFIKKQLMEYAMNTLHGDWVVWQDGDTIFNRAGTDEDGIAQLIERGEANGIQGWGVHWKNCYMHPRWYRTDSQFNDFGQTNLFKLTPEIVNGFDPTPGLHQKQTPNLVMDDQTEVEIFHLGFASPQALEDKYRMYYRHGQRHWALERIITMRHLTLECIPEEEMPIHYCPDAGERPEPISFKRLKNELPPWGLDEQWMEDLIP
jgi:hypothetical protein